MKTRKLGELVWAASTTGAKFINFDSYMAGDASIYSQIQVVRQGGTGDGTFASNVSGWAKSDRTGSAALTSDVAGDTIHVDVPKMPYMRVVVNMSGAPTEERTIEVWAVE